MPRPRSSWSLLVSALAAVPILVAAIPSATSSAQGPAPASAHWRGPQQLSPGGGRATGVACPSARNCVAVDAGGNAASYRGTAWQTPREVDNGWGRLSDVSCTRGGFCAAVGDGVTLVRGHGGWRSAQHWPRSFDRVSCGSARRCLATGPGRSLLWNGSAWRPLAAPSASRGEINAACSATVCMAVDASGRAFRLTGRTWHGAGVLHTPGTRPADFSEASLACPGPSSCTLATQLWRTTPDVAFRWNGHRWRGRLLPMPDNTFKSHRVSVACPSASHCVLVDNGGWARRYDGSWRPRVRVYRGGYNSHTRWPLSCPSRHFCLMIAGEGHPVRFDGRWHRAASYPRKETPGLRVSCTSADFCMAMADDGHASRYDGSGWAGVPTDASADATRIRRLSCTGPTFCQALDRRHRVVTWNGSAWSAPVDLPVGDWAYLACSAPDFCLVADGSGDPAPVLVWDGTTWQQGPAAPFGVRALQCPAVRACLAGSAGHTRVAELSGGAWGAPQVVDPARPTFVDGVETLACSAIDHCLLQATTAHGRGIFTYLSGPAGWSPPFGKPYFTAASCNQSICEATASSGNRLFTLHGQTWSHRPEIGPPGYVATRTTDLSCAADGTCALVDSNGSAFVRP